MKEFGFGLPTLSVGMGNSDRISPMLWRVDKCPPPPRPPYPQWREEPRIDKAEEVEAGVEQPADEDVEEK